ncbi:hypothetical protein CTAYLR_001296 [Chrysophaeum taylorii]|uniref:Plastid lipid-associated protein/fibrillin conserved domain-containing protein n=1 Tax=Chrysophaeum taylorii TaxID=2483200 RepID=A0AAD7XI94_9STRA|nr:hypothetical protein CTAYLR_001296 [Chrysophaeum taylorii]
MIFFAWWSSIFLAARGECLSTTTTRDASTARAKALRVLDEELAPGRFTCDNLGASRRVESAVAALERASEVPMFPRDLMQLDGIWKLRYTNNAPPSPPRELMDVVPSFGSPTSAFQKVDVRGRRVVNIVCLGPPADDSLGETVLKRLPFVGPALAKAKVRLDLDHSFAVDGEDRARHMASTNRLIITLERVVRSLDGNFDDAPAVLRDFFLRPTLDLSVPDPLKAINNINTIAGTFDTTFCDDTLRVSRGVSPLGRELRVFVKCTDADVPVGLEGSAPGGFATSSSSASLGGKGEQDDLPGDPDADEFIPSD